VGREGQGPKQQRIHDAEDRSAAAYAERKRKQRRRGKARRTQQNTNAITEILHQRIHNSSPSSVTFATAPDHSAASRELIDIPELRFGLATRRGVTQPRRAQFFRSQLDVKRQLALDVASHVAAPEREPWNPFHARVKARAALTALTCFCHSACCCRRA